MPFADYVPQFGDSNLSTYYRNVLGVPVRKRIVIAVLTVLILFFIFVGAVLYAKYRNTPGENGKSEVLPPYIPIASAVNTSVDPCSNFYEFTCGLWSKNKLVSESSESTVSSFSILQDFIDEKKKNVLINSEVSDDLPRVVNDAIEFYHMCVSSGKADVTEINFLLNYFKQAMGGWPILDPENWDGDDFNWIKTSAYLLRTLGVETIASVQSIVDDKNSSQRVLYLRPPIIPDGMLSENSYMLETVLNCLNHSDIRVMNVTESIDAIRETESEWMTYFSIDSPLSQNRIRMTFKELREKIPHFDWRYYINLLLNDTLTKMGQDISEDDIVVVSHYEFLGRAIAKFESKKFSKFELANLFGWFVTQNIWFFIPGVASQYSGLFGYSGDERRKFTNNQCFETLQELYDCSIDFLFVQKTSHSGISDGKILVHNIKQALRELIRSSDWLDDSTKKLAIIKLNSMKSVIGFQNYLGNKFEFEKLYQSFPQLSSSVMQTYFEIKTHFTYMLVNEIKFQNFSDYVSPRSITHVSAYNEFQKNTFTLPISLYNPPFYHYNGPWYLNFGAMGSIVGHEIMHGFDNVGGHHDKTGTLNNWWSKHALEEFKHRSNCFDIQYATYKETNTSDSKVSTLNEDIADSEGLRLAYLAYKYWVKTNGPDPPYLIRKKKYSPEQMFFISFGLVWCSKISDEWHHMSHNNPVARIIGAVSNLEDFSKVFNCPNGSPMNPERKCSVW